MDRVYIFLGLFATVLFLEATGGSYMISAVQSIERQFQIPSKLSGFLISASDISYVPTVIFISYLGSRGNRAKWIGAGTVLMAMAHIFTATPNFIFPAEQPKLNLTTIEETLLPAKLLSEADAKLEQFFEYQPIRDRIPSDLLSTDDTPFKVYEQSLYSLDEPLISQALHHMNLILSGDEDEKPLLEVLRKFVKNRHINTQEDFAIIRRAAIAPFTFCGKLVNDLRSVLTGSFVPFLDLKCHQKSSNVGPLLIIFTALLALGIGRTMPWSLGIPLIDDNVKKHSMPLYFACISFIRILGPITGFIIGSLANKLYFTTPTPQGLSPTDPTWIGAWWLGFLLIGIITILPSCILFFFPASSNSDKVMPTENETKPKKKNQLLLFDKHMDEKRSPEEQTLKGGAKAFLKSYKDVVGSKIYVGTVIGRILDVLAFKGYVVFLPKYLENHYGIPQYRVQLYMAAFGVFGFALGTITGGLITRKFKLNGRKVALFVLIVSTINTLMYLSKCFLGCHSIVNSVGLDGASTNFNYTRSCNMDCGCQGAQLFPVCDPSGNVYYSPCHAGCRHVSVLDLGSYNLEFSDCDCVPGKIVKKEFCHDNCSFMTVAFFVTVMIGAFIAGTGVVPGMLILLRSVPPATRSISLGLQGFLVSLLGTLPSPVIWGFIIDSACLVWEQTCSSRGACAIYDPIKLRLRMHLLYVAIRMISMFSDLYVLYHSKNLNILEDPDEDNEQDENEEVKRVEDIQLSTMH
uniref:Solute carrier organic anion transporter family member n=1 Tax=Acrobeloides nanus TaxID=290746 RepID=A0A914CLE7_9BILA